MWYQETPSGVKLPKWVDGFLKIWIWAILILIDLLYYAVLVGGACLFLKYFFIDDLFVYFKLKTFIGTVLLATVSGLVRNAYYYRCKVDEKVRKAKLILS